MSALVPTEAPWQWFSEKDGRVYLATPDRGRLYVVDFGRKGMRGATPRFSHWTGLSEGESRGRRGGIMEDGVFLSDGTLHPDAQLIEMAPDLLGIVRTFDAYMGHAGQEAEKDSLNPIKALRWEAQQLLGTLDRGVPNAHP